MANSLIQRQKLFAYVSKVLKMLTCALPGIKFENIRTLHRSQAGEFPMTSPVYRYSMVRCENKLLGLLSYLNPHKTLVFMVLIEKTTYYKESGVLK